MSSTFIRQIELCARNGFAVPPPPVAKADSSPLIPRATCDKSDPDRTLDHEKEAAFLKALLAYEEGGTSRQLQDSLAKAERERKRIRHAMFLMVTLLILSLAGLGFCAVLRPQILFNPTHFLTWSLSILGLAALIAQLEFFAYLLWHGSAVDRLLKDCRRRVLLLVESQLRASVPPSPRVDASQEPESSLAGARAQPTAGPTPEPA